MTIQKARKILGKKAKNIPDEEIMRDIEIATLFKDLFFSNLMQNGLASTSEMCHN